MGPILLSTSLVSLASAAAPASDGAMEVELDLFVDTLWAIDSQDDARALGDGTARHRSLVVGEGFQLSFVGLDARATWQTAAATASLRFGPSVIRYFGDQGPSGFDNLTQGYVTWRPLPELTFDLGQFNTIYGAEVAESWQNANYTRGALYHAMQPFWHVGLRTRYAPSDAFTVVGLVANGVNTAFDLDDSPALGAQVSHAGDGFGLTLGYMWTTNAGEEPGDFFAHLVDAIASVEWAPCEVVLNADWGASDDAIFYGVALGPRCSLDERFAIGARGEYLAWPDDTPTDHAPGVAAGIYDGLVTATLTLDWRPGGSRWLVLRPEVRYERALGAAAFAAADGRPTAHWWTALLGATAHTW